MSLHLFPVTIGKIDPPIHGILSQPEQKLRTLPTVIYFHGLNGTRNQPFQDRYRGIAELFQQRQVNFLSVDLREHGERRHRKHGTPTENILHMLKEGDANPIEQAFEDFQRLVEFVIEKQIARPPHIGAMGLSWGALHAMYALQQEEQIQTAVALLPVCCIHSLVEFRKFHNHPKVMPYEPLEFLRTLAPKPLLMITAEKDTRSRASYASDLYHQLLEDYRRAAAEENLIYAMMLDHGHSFHQRMTELTNDWIDRFLVADHVPSPAAPNE